MQNQTDLYDQPSTYSALDFVIGLLITIGASLANALGLNITKLDFVRQEAIPVSQRRPDFLRPYWLLGLLLYIASQVLGSTLALNFLPAQYVAPLGSTSLIFNTIFAFLLVGTPIIRLDVIGTITIILGVVGVVVFGNIRTESKSQFDESNLSLSVLKEMWSRSDWIVYLVFLEVATVLFWWLSRITHEVCIARITDDRGDADRDGSGLDQMMEGGGGRRNNDPYAGERWVGRAKSARDAWHRGQGRVRKVVQGYVERWSQSRSEVSIRKMAGLMWSVTGGLLSGQTLVLAKSAVKLVTSAIDKSDPNGGNQFASPLTWVIIILLVVTAVAQVYALNQSLKCYDSTFTVPCFFATYTVSGFINSLVYLDQTKTYKTWVFALIWVSIAILVVGVILLSSKPSPKPKTRQNRSGSSASTTANPFDDPAYELDSPVKPGFARQTTDIEAAAPAAEEPQRKRGQGWLSKLFGGLPAVEPATSTPSAPSTATQTGSSTPSASHKQDDLESADGASVFNSERTSQRDAEELEMDEVDRLGYAASVKSSKRGVEDEDDFGDFEAATGAKRVDPDDVDRK
ncbi:hypothetical protein JCM11251_006447 [Rhodosporidiobolus azoricus]